LQFKASAKNTAKNILGGWLLIAAPGISHVFLQILKKIHSAIKPCLYHAFLMFYFATKSHSDPFLLQTIFSLMVETLWLASISPSKCNHWPYVTLLQSIDDLQTLQHIS